METSITSKMVSQQTICGDIESLNLGITYDTESILTQNKDQMDIEQTWENLVKARYVYFKYFPSQRMAQTKSSVQRRAIEGGKVIIPLPSLGQPTDQSKSGKQPWVPQIGKGVKKIKKSKA